MILKASAVLKKEIIISNSARNILLIGLFAVLTFLGALLRVHLPFTPVPMTMQTFVLFLSVYYLSSKNIGISQSLYVIAGMIGVPVFAAGITGAIALVGPTAGYLMGFIIAGMVMVKLKDSLKRSSFISMLVIFAAGLAIVYFMGAAHLVMIYKVPVKSVIAMGVAPFVAADMLKAVAAASLFKLIK